MEALVGLEAGGEERSLLGGGEGGRDHAVESLARQTVDAPAEEVRRGRGPFGYRGQISEVGVPPPGSDPRPFGTPFDDGTIAGTDHAP